MTRPIERAGTLRVLGVGPGDPELITLKAARLCAASPVVAYFAKRGAFGHARRTAAAHISAASAEIRLEYPITTEIPHHAPGYRETLDAFYRDTAELLGAHLAQGADIALLCEGDPIFYGSGLHLLERLGARFACEIVPGVSGMSGCWARAGAPLLRGENALSVLPATLPAADLAARLHLCEAAVILKLGRNLGKLRDVLKQAGLFEGAIYVERGTMAGERILPLAAFEDDTAPYFSLLLIPPLPST